MKKIIWTCDTEIGENSKCVDNTYDVFVAGKVSGREVGVKFINKIASDYGAIINHFVDIYPPEYEKELSRLCYNIVSEGHQVGLHTHPSTRYGKRYMYEYDLEQQKRIVEYGVNFFKSIMGIVPLFHRAGGYGADNNTLEALREFGIKIDSSYYHNNSECKLSYDDINAVKNLGNDKALIEVPITVYNMNKTFGGFKKGPYFQKLDFRYGSCAEKILQVIDMAPDNSVIVLFLHSFNFLNLIYSSSKKNYKEISVNDYLINEYISVLEGIKMRTDCCYLRLSDICAEANGFNINIDEKIKISHICKRVIHNCIGKDEIMF